MTLNLERSAIERYFGTAWGATTPVILDEQGGEPAANSVRLTIKSGAVLQGSIGRMSNRINNVGMIMFEIYTEGGKGSAAWRGYAEAITDLFFEKALTSAGVLITNTADTFIRFSPPELGDNRHPYIAASFPDAPFQKTNLNVPFIRLSYR